VHANEAFVKWTAEGFQKLEESGIQFLTWPGRDDLARFVFSHCTSNEETETLCARLAELGDGSPPRYLSAHIKKGQII
jgi:threonine aldolase